MGVPHITSFCCCMGLEMGTKVIGFVHLLVSITVIIVSSLFASAARGYMNTLVDEDKIYTTSYKVAVTIAVVTIAHVLLAATLLFSAFKVAVTIAVVTIAHVLLAATLLFSAFKRSTTGLRLWVWVMCLLYVCAVVFIIVQTCLHGLADSGSHIFLAFLEGIVFFGAVAYSILCVNSYYLMVRSAEDMEGPGKTYY